MTTRVHLDHAASTPMRRVAVDRLVEWSGLGANASGSHASARLARRVVDDAREQLADVLGVDPGTVVFTSGGTESDNLAVFGRVDACGGRVVGSAVEHPAVREAVHRVGGKEFGVDRRGVVDLDQLVDVLDEDVSLVALMAVNNEVGTVQPVVEAAELVRQHAPRAAVLTDAVQALTWLDLREVAPHVDLLALSAHKFGGPQGVGALVVRDGCRLSARAIGGGQERERRSGTSNVAGIAAMAAAAVEADATRADAVARLRGLRDRLTTAVCAAVDGVMPTVPSVTDEGSDDAPVAAGFVHLCVAGIDSEALLFLLDAAGIDASAASACASGAQQRSHVLAAMGVDDDWSAGALRLSLGHTTTADDVDAAAAALISAIRRLREFPR